MPVTILVTMSDQSFPKQLRLRTSAEFERVYAAECYAADGVLVINATTNDLGHSRLGLSISRKVGNAVVRNRWKRLIREAFRLQRSALPSGIDFVVRPKRGAVPEFVAIKESLRKLAARVAKRLLTP